VDNPGATTIAAIASAPPSSGDGSRTLVRLSGPATPDALAALGVDDLPVRGVRTALITRPLGLPVVLLRTLRNASYTGEDSAELLLPANASLVARVLDAVLAVPGVRAAHPGEFSARAYTHGNLTLAQAEGVAAVIAARTADELAAARRVMSGSFGEDARAWSDGVAGLLALVEAGIDFTDQEDVVAITPADLRTRALALAEELAGVSGSKHAQADRDGVVVALVGPPNTGKSTLFNALLGRERAIASPRAGSTRDAIEEALHLPERVLLQDLPGLDAGASGPSASAAQHAAREALARADVLLWCDPAGRFDASEIVPWIGEAALQDKTVLRVRTIADRAAAPTRSAGLPVCAIDGRNLATLREELREALSKIATRAHAGLVVPRHRVALREAESALRRLAGLIDDRAFAPEVAADDLRLALSALGEITGAVTPDDVLGRIFSSFCVGK
jgi:tRNA modification GTPase